MDPPHGLPRKRKQVTDDAQDVECTVVDDGETHVPNVPRCSHSKRPRLHRHPRSRLGKKSRSSVRPPPVDRFGNDIEDHGIVNNTEPGPLTGSLLNLRRRTPPIVTIDPSAVLDLPVPIDVAMTLVPPTHPYVTRNTLKELDLDVILRSPQLRHDLLFDHGLQFRPTCNRRKKQLSQAYWNALTREIESGCTCFSIDRRAAPTAACICSQIPDIPSNPIVGYCLASQVMTVRMPSRLRPLLSEFLEVLLLVIQPLQSVSGMYVNPDLFRAQMEEHSTQANYIRSIFDPALIEQELKHDVFDLASLLRVIGSTLKGHCAPMRDHAVEEMVRAAETCKPGGRGTKADAVNAVRACLDILEVMKLDIANHQLQSLRVSISRTAAVYELQNFKTKSTTWPFTQQWLNSNNIDFRSIGRNRQIYIGVLKGMTDLVFHPPPETGPTSLTDYPETTYLDQARLRSLSKDVGDLAVSYMLLLLFRQLIYSSDWEDTCSRAPQVRVDDATLLKIKNEILVIHSATLGNMLRTPEPRTTSQLGGFKDNLVLHIVKRAQDLRRPTLHKTQAPSTLSPTSDCSSCSPSPSPSPSSVLPMCTFGSPPDVRIVNIAQRWVVENINTASPLCSVIMDRLHEVVFAGVVAQAYPGRQYTTSQLFSSAIESPSLLRQGGQSYTIRTLTDKISRVAIMHLNVYLPIYEDGLLET
ncbi:T-complex protein 11-domain-containing protein [Rhodocollybia butyracea]|uniref:T-complex protein 11-domain-containing protein n=1 Tax=Rhodocollybia butyracea TaxID=206335 RepID=A0A9P5QAD3_9AGAR|nr:T-complex protein 11-domain-containing protein [Rhodocollybia butyracea]